MTSTITHWILHHQWIYRWLRVADGSYRTRITMNTQWCPMTMNTTNQMVRWHRHLSIDGTPLEKPTQLYFDKTWPYESTNSYRCCVPHIHIGYGCETSSAPKALFPQIVYYNRNCILRTDMKLKGFRPSWNKTYIFRILSAFVAKNNHPTFDDWMTWASKYSLRLKNTSNDQEIFNSQ
jgi:hypothetical protein